MRIPSLLILASFTGLAACGKLVDKVRDRKAPREDSKSAVIGPLGQYVERLQTSKYAASCDRKHSGIEKKLAAALDAKESEIVTFSATLPPSKMYRRVQMGPVFVRELIDPVAPKPGWQSSTYDWTQLDELFMEIQNQPINLNWLSLSVGVRGILVNDEDRIEYASNMYLARSDYEILPKISQRLAACLDESTCMAPAYDDAEAKLVATNPYFKEFGSDRRSLAKLKEWLDIDMKRKTTHINEGVKMMANGDIDLPLDPGPFADVKDQLAKYITDVWTGSGMQVRIRWTTIEADADAYKFVLEEGTGGRAFVDYKTKTIHLYADVRAKSIAHEIGHVLAFPDYYYTTWNPETCKYTDEFTEENLMSSNGIVTTDLWQVLQDLYPVESSPK
jgi:hypothetical protein